MRTRTPHEIPGRLAAIRRRFDRWRLTRQGRSRIPFSVVQATLEQDGHLVLDLTTDESTVWESPHQVHLASVALCHENRKLVFPPEKIDAQGRVVIVGTLTAGIEIRSLPLSAVEMTVIAAEEVPSSPTVP
ncbi:MAG: hypothetical protein GXY55_14210 [Phycisphaerae bacterium]|nr:hypothetical protein [Phycisphaerae bacterium]